MDPAGRGYVKAKSFAKINLGIEIVRRRRDQYHEIRTLFQTVNLYDELEFQILGGPEILIKGNDPSIPWDESNLIHRAAVLLRKESGVESGVSVRVNKRIPPGRGLGGGSGNAAVTLLALNRIWRLGWPGEKLRDLGGRLGADVPYFFTGGLALGLGRGDICFPLEDFPSRHAVIILPAMAVPTASVYGNLRISLTLNPKDSKIIRFLDTGELCSLRNELEDTIFSLYPQLKNYKSLIKSPDSELSLVSGSGSAVFSLFPQREQAEAAAAHSSGEHTVLVVDTLSRADYWKGLSTGV